MDALKLLKADHDRIKPMLAELKETTDRAEKTRGELFSRIKQELTIHEIIEEEIFYPTLKEHPKAKEIVLEGYEEHDVVSRLMGELDGMDATEEAWGPKAKVMAENVEHHIEEEEGEMFKAARQVFDDDELEQLGEKMAERKRAATEEAWGPKAKVMAENVEHHIEEEEGEMFRAARQVFDDDELEQLGEKMAERKQAATEELFGAAVR